jgi:chromosome segregation ATPase
VLATETQLLEDRLRTGEREIEAARAKLTEAQLEQRSAGQSVTNMERELSAAKQEAAALAERLGAAQAAETKAQEQLQVCRLSAEEKKAAFEAGANQSMLVTKLMAATAPGKPLHRARLYGRLGALSLLRVRLELWAALNLDGGRQLGSD